jgi:hypothetical protein
MRNAADKMEWTHLRRLTVLTTQMATVTVMEMATATLKSPKQRGGKMDRIALPTRRMRRTETLTTLESLMAKSMVSTMSTIADGRLLGRRNTAGMPNPLLLSHGTV